MHRASERTLITKAVKRHEDQHEEDWFLRALSWPSCLVVRRNPLQTLTFLSIAATMSACGRAVSSAKNFEWRDHRSRGGGRWRAARHVSATPLSGQAPAAYRAPRAADGHPDLNGIWQANTEANYDLEAHMARPAMALRAGPYGPVPAAAVLALGAVGSVPPGMGVVEGGRDSLQAGGARQEKREPGELAGARSGDQVLPAGRAARDLHAASVPDSPEQRARSSSRTSTPARCATST